MNVRRAQSGWTVLGMLIVFFTIAIIFSIGTFIVRGGCGAAGDVENEARAYATQTGEPFTGISCMGMDSDGDGYVSCSVFRPNKEPLAIECARKFTFNSGCKLAIARIRR